MSKPIVIRVASPLAEGLLDAGLAEPLPSTARDGALGLVVDASLVIKDVASVVLAVAAGQKGIRAALDWLRRSDEAEVVVTVHSPEAERTWTLPTGTVDEATVREVTVALEALEAGPIAESE
jgi:hypothetical protein